MVGRYSKKILLTLMSGGSSIDPGINFSRGLQLANRSHHNCSSSLGISR